MNVMLVSHDADLFKLCREVLNELDGLDWQLSELAPDANAATADLCIWDGPPAAGLAPKIDQCFSKHLFLLNRSEVKTFQEHSGAAEAAILLKPVTRAYLSAFLGLAASTFQSRDLSTRALRTDRDEMLQCLIQSNLQLQKVDQDRTNFMTRAVHDFRAPLTATGGYCGLLLSGALGPLTEEQKEVLRRMEHSTKRLSRMASAMFELGVGRQIKRQPDLRPGDIRESVEQAMHEITPLAEGKNLSISLEPVPEFATMHLEPGQIEQVLINLLDNACKFTPRGGSIEIRGYPFYWERRTGRHYGASVKERRRRDCRSSNSYRVDIRNSGPRIPKEHMGRIFEEYTSYVGGKDRSGGGLGLAICKMIITAHDGRVWMENTEDGPQFSFVLPLRFTKLEGLRADHLLLMNTGIN